MKVNVFIVMAIQNKKAPYYIALWNIICQTFFTVLPSKNIMDLFLIKILKKADFSKLFLYLPSTLDRKEEFLQWKDHVHLHPIDVSYEELKKIHNGGDMNLALLDNKELRRGVTAGYYKMMKKTAEISNQNLVRNSDAYLSSGGKVDPDNEFSWVDDSYKKGKDKFQLGY